MNPSSNVALIAAISRSAKLIGLSFSSTTSTSKSLRILSIEISFSELSSFTVKESIKSFTSLASLKIFPFSSTMLPLSSIVYFLSSISKTVPGSITNSDLDLSSLSLSLSYVSV